LNFVASIEPSVILVHENMRLRRWRTQEQRRFRGYYRWQKNKVIECVDEPFTETISLMAPTEVAQLNWFHLARALTQSVELPSHRRRYLMCVE
jgi:hypothetical protein